MTSSHVEREDEAWSAARDATRDDVRAALAPRPRTCPACGHAETGPVRTCSACGADLVAHRRRRPPRRVVLAAAAALLLLAGAAVALTAPMRDSAARERQAAARAQARLEAAERVRLLADVRPVRTAGPRRRPGEDPLGHRARLVAAGEAAVTADARRRVSDGTMDGPVRGTTCEPFPATATRAAQERDPAVASGRYQCIAYERRFALPELQGRARTGVLGQPYWLVADYATARLAFCKVTPRAGEGGQSLVSVPVPPPCRDPQRDGGRR